MFGFEPIPMSELRMPKQRRELFCMDFHSRTCPSRDMGGDNPRALYCQRCLSYKGRHRKE